MMESVLLAIGVGLGVYVLGVLLLPRRLVGDTRSFTRQMLDRLADEAEANEGNRDDTSIVKEYMAAASPLTKLFCLLPGGDTAYRTLLRAGMGPASDRFFMASVALLCLLLFTGLRLGLGLLSPLLAVVVTYFLCWKFLARQVRKRNEAFLNLFPDALDMIVRSVKTGYPLNAAIKMVAENMVPPVSTEFRQVAEEVAYGRPLLEALQRMTVRIDEPDIRFFTVVLAVQHEAGGNLAEVLSNLSTIIRKRKHLRMKIKALTSEGRTTAWILGSLPVLLFGVLSFLAPEHLRPLFITDSGRMILTLAITLVASGAWIVRQMIDIDI
jgi:tight adherence protein B